MKNEVLEVFEISLRNHVCSVETSCYYLSKYEFLDRKNYHSKFTVDLPRNFPYMGLNICLGNLTGTFLSQKHPFLHLGKLSKQCKDKE